MDSHLWKPWRLQKPAPTSDRKCVWKAQAASQLSRTATTNHGGRMNNSVAALTNTNFRADSSSKTHLLWVIYVLLLPWEWPVQLGSGPKSKAPAVCFSKRVGSAWQKLMSLSIGLTRLEQKPTYWLNLASVCAWASFNEWVRLGLYHHK